MKLPKYITIAVMLSMLACSESQKVEPYNYPEIISGPDNRTWAIRNVQVIPVGKSAVTLTPRGRDSCRYFDKYSFYNNTEKSFRITSVQCDEEAPAVIADSNWSFVNATSTLSMSMPLISDPPYPPLPFILKEIDDNKMTVDIYFGDGTAYRVNFKIVSSGD